MAEKNKLTKKELLKQSLKKSQTKESNNIILSNETKSIDPTINQLKDLYESVIMAHKRTVRNSIDFGEYLFEVKEKIGHGNFIPYIEKNKAYLGFDRRTASTYLRIYYYRELVKGCKNMAEAVRLIKTQENGLPQPEQRVEIEINPKLTTYKYSKGKKLYTIFKQSGKSKKGFNKIHLDFIRQFIEEELQKENERYNNKVSDLKSDLKHL
ncbi:DUF3102 domain-containing protein [Leptospira noguchii]|uniref:PF11300 domain protein n=1 Tax=Leptospira noguchii str. 2001034031 TaxID=1193053 RepID=M6YBA2_9LEPT|nr:DUF3102 domain-containing protein [Leptospira noguchii]EMO89141.1 PF11300 domain protein [Leptospira noguchii str. 2001034031]